jgi:hypothetical protein
MVRAARVLCSPVIVLPTSHTFADPYEMDALNIYYRTIREVSGDLGCEMVAVHTYWAGFLSENPSAQARLVQKDARLPSEQGHGIFAEVILKTLDRIIPGIQGNTSL